MQPVNRVDFGAGTEAAPGDGSVLDRDGTHGNPFGGIGVDVGFDHHAAMFTGFVRITTAGSYTFTVRSDDAATPSISTSNVLVAADVPHACRTPAAAVVLSAVCTRLTSSRFASATAGLAFSLVTPGRIPAMCGRSCRQRLCWMTATVAGRLSGTILRSARPGIDRDLLTVWQTERRSRTSRHRGRQRVRGGRGRRRRPRRPLRVDRRRQDRLVRERRQPGRSTGRSTDHAPPPTAPVSVFAADVDGDGDIDVLSASRVTTRSPGTRTTAARTSRPHTISTAADGASSVFAADVDGDGDLDVLSASSFDDKIAWYENAGVRRLATPAHVSRGAGRGSCAARRDAARDWMLPGISRTTASLVLGSEGRRTPTRTAVHVRWMPRRPARRDRDGQRPDRAAPADVDGGSTSTPTAPAAGT